MVDDRIVEEACVQPSAFSSTPIHVTRMENVPVVPSTSTPNPFLRDHDHVPFVSCKLSIASTTPIEQVNPQDPTCPSTLEFRRKRGRPKKSAPNITPTISSSIDDLVLYEVEGEPSTSSRKRGRPRKEREVPLATLPNIEEGEASDALFVEVTDEAIQSEYAIPKVSDGRVFQPIEWKSGKNLLLEPNDTFFTLPECIVDGFPLLSSQRRLTPFQLFLSLFPLEVIDSIIAKTNRYAREARREARDKYSTIRAWADIDRHVLFQFLGLVLAATLNPLPNTKAYWRSDVVGAVQYPAFSQKTSLACFQQVKRFLHLRDNADRSTKKKTQEYRCWQFLKFEEFLNTSLKKCYQMGDVTIDEE
ncbi:hypothetical protein L7F22_042646 [Adiantum nelumboides]|nr:hypothetical protein [Adiantum nelumboides]